jgi:hypothetical protein
MNEQPFPRRNDRALAARQHRFAGVPGLVDRRKNRRTRTRVSFYHATQAGLDATSGEWALVCEAHYVQRNYPTQAEAYRHLGAGDWCPACCLARPPLEAAG